MRRIICKGSLHRLAHIAYGAGMPCIRIRTRHGIFGGIVNSRQASREPAAIRSVLRQIH
jgi:hypothetical protein